MIAALVSVVNALSLLHVGCLFFPRTAPTIPTIRHSRQIQIILRTIMQRFNKWFYEPLTFTRSDAFFIYLGIGLLFLERAFN